MLYPIVVGIRPTTITNNMGYPTVLPGIAHNNNKQHVLSYSFYLHQPTTITNNMLYPTVIPAWAHNNNKQHALSYSSTCIGPQQ